MTSCPRGANAGDDVDAKRVKQMKDGKGKVEASCASGDTLSHLGTQEVISRMVGVMEVVTIQK